MNNKMTLSGDLNVPEMEMKDSEVNHLRLLLAWLRCEYMLDEDMQRGFLNAATECIDRGVASREKVIDVVQIQADRINKAPKYVRQAVKMLTIAIRKHEEKSRIIE